MSAKYAAASLRILTFVAKDVQIFCAKTCVYVAPASKRADTRATFKCISPTGKHSQTEITLISHQKRNSKYLNVRASKAAARHVDSVSLVPAAVTKCFGSPIVSSPPKS